MKFTREALFENNSELQDFWLEKSTGPKANHFDFYYQMASNDSKFKNHLLDQINQAQSVIMIASYLIGDDDLINLLLKKKEIGVRIYVLTSQEAQLERERDIDIDENAQKMIEHHKSILRKIRTNLLVRGAPNLHAKVVLIDPFDNPSGFLLTANLNLAMTRNPEVAIALKPKAVSELFEAFRYAFWQEATHEWTGQKWKVAEKKAIPDFKKWDHIISSIKRRNNIESTLNDILTSTEGDVYIASYKISDEVSLIKNIEKRAQMDKVFLFSKLHPDNQAVYKRFSKNPNIKMFASRFFHAKFIFTKSIGVVTSANFQEISFKDGFELGIMVKEKLNEIIKSLDLWVQTMDSEFVRSELYKNLENTSIKRFTNGRYLESKIKKVEDVKKIKCKTVGEFLDWETKEILLPKFNGESRVNIKYNINPPLLPVNAKEIKSIEDVKNIAIQDKLREVFDDKISKHSVHVLGKDIFVKVKDKKEFNKLNEKIVSETIVVF
jgi:phosphatidylserine/phosphatidylglycerophosphate/cardiolipin synthase-like enzyme